MKSYAVVYPFGTSNSYELFSERADACSFLDKESNQSNLMLPDQSLQLFLINMSVEEVEEAIFNDKDTDADVVIYNLAEANETVKHWRGHEIWAEKDADGYYYYLAESHKVKPEVEHGGTVVKAWKDEDEIYESEEELVNVNSPSQYLCTI